MGINLITLDELSHFKYVFNSRTPLSSPWFQCLFVRVAMRWRGLPEAERQQCCRWDAEWFDASQHPTFCAREASCGTDTHRLVVWLSLSHRSTVSKDSRSISITFTEKKSPRLIKWLIKLRGFTNCVTSSLKYSIHVPLANVIDSDYGLELLVFCSAALLANPACERELYNHNAKMYFQVSLYS